jgi:hypothetical protein
MSDTKPEATKTDDKPNYSAEIENIKKEVAINKQVEGWITDAVKKTKGEMEEKLSQRFWNGFLIGLIVAVIIMFFWRR